MLFAVVLALMKLGKRWVKQIVRSDDIATWVPAVSEISCGSCCKYRLDKRSGQLILARALGNGVAFPTNYGFIPRTRSSDGDELDLLVLTKEPLLPLTVLRVRIVGGFVETTQGEGREPKLLGVALDDPSVSTLNGLAEVPQEIRSAIEHFVVTYKQDQQIEVTFDGWFDEADALKRLTKAFARW